MTASGGTTGSLLPAALRAVPRLVLLAAVLLIAACDPPWRVAGGSGTETSNGEIVAGRVLLPDGGPAAGADVWVRPAGYLRDTADLDARLPAADAVTDKQGYFRVRALEPGSYRAEVRDKEGRAALLTFELGDPAPRDTATDILRPAGVLQGRALPAQGLAGPVYVQVYGLERLVRTDDSGRFEIRDLPAGAVKFRVVTSRPGMAYASPVLAVIQPGDTVVAEPLAPITFANEDYAAWPFSRRIAINTQAAGLSDTVTDFPLLVRLDGSRFDFDLSDGKDVRFSGPDGRHLPYQLDSWDAEGRQAAFWVKLDTVLGGSRDQYVTLHFGRRDAPDFSNGQAVFASFGGAWHFSEPVDAEGEGIFADASPSLADAAARVLPKERLGAIGAGAGFRGTHQVVAPAAAASLRPTKAVTLSAWVHLSAAGPNGAEFASLGDHYGIRGNKDGNSHFFVFSDTSVKDPAWKSGNAFPGAWTTGPDIRGDWHLVTGRFDGTTVKVFVDGFERASREHALDIHYVFVRELRMGLHGNGAPGYAFTGSLDEVQMSPLARSPGWIRLAYESQRPGSTLLEFR